MYRIGNYFWTSLKIHNITCMCVTLKSVAFQYHYLTKPRQNLFVVKFALVS